MVQPVAGDKIPHGQAVMPLDFKRGASSGRSGNDLTSLYQRCIDAWGAPVQVSQAAEECIELALALHHLLRAKKTKALMETIEEIVDVELCIAQVKYMLEIPETAVTKFKQKKIRRLKKMLKEVGDGKTGSKE